jgi:hypothetical protein
MKAKRPVPARGEETRRKPRQQPRAAGRRADVPPRRRTREQQRPQRSAPQTSPVPRPVDAPARPKSASQAKARAKARKAKAPKVVRPPLKQRLLLRLSSIELDPRRLIARVPFVVLVIGALGVGLALTLWLSTDAAQRSYQLGHARETNQALLQQKEALERDVLEAQAAPALAEEARKLGMIPSRDTAHLVQDAAGNWVVVGTPKPAEGAPPPPLNTPVTDDKPVPPPPPAPAPGAAPPGPEVPVRLPSRAALPGMPGAVAPLTVPVVPGGTVPTVPGATVPVVPGAPVPPDAHGAAGGLPALGPVAPAPLVAPAAPAPAAAPVVPAPAVAPAPVDPGAQHLPAAAPVAPGPPALGEQFAPVAAPAAGPQPGPAA